MAGKEGLLPFKLIEELSGEALTSYSGLPTVVSVVIPPHGSSCFAE